MKDQESLQSSALVSHLADSVQDKIHNLLANGIMSSGIVIGSVLLSSNQLLRVEQLPVGSSPDFINNGRLQVNKDGPGNMLSGTSFSEKGAEGVISHGLV